jgi:hypothetical protein
LIHIQLLDKLSPRSFQERGDLALRLTSIAWVLWYTGLNVKGGGRTISGRIVVAGIVVFVLLIALIVGSFFIGQTLVDIFIILAALASIAAFALLGYAAMQVVGLVKEVRGEVQGLIGTAQDTMNEVRGTARFIGDTVIEPVSRTAAFVSATRATIKSFTEPLYKNRS